MPLVLQGSFTDNISVLDTGTMLWRDLTVEASQPPPTAKSGAAGAASSASSSAGLSPGEARGPKARADSQIVYDPFGKRVVMVRLREVTVQRFGQCTHRCWFSLVLTSFSPLPRLFSAVWRLGEPLVR
jgi:hypothetical protein